MDVVIKVHAKAGTHEGTAFKFYENNGLLEQGASTLSIKRADILEVVMEEVPNV